MNKDMFESKVKEKLANYEVAPPKDMFSKISNQLGTSAATVKESKTVVLPGIIKYGAVASTVFLMGMSFMYYLNHNAGVTTKEVNFSSNQTVNTTELAKTEQPTLVENNTDTKESIIIDNQSATTLAKNTAKVVQINTVNNKATNTSETAVAENQKSVQYAQSISKGAETKIIVVDNNSKTDNVAQVNTPAQEIQTTTLASNEALATDNSNGIVIHGGVKVNNDNKVKKENNVYAQSNAIDSNPSSTEINQTYSLYKYNNKENDGITYERIETENNNIRFFTPVKK